MKKLMVFAMAVCAMAGAFAAANEAMTKDVNVVVTSLSVRQRYPWNGKVDIDFSIDSEFPEAFSFVRFGASYKNGGGETVNVPMRTFDHGTSWFCASSGTYRVTWDSSADVPDLMVTNLQYTVTANMAKYMVVDLSKGTSATADNPYPITYLEECPDPTRMDGGWTNRDKTTNLVLRLIQPGTYKQAWNDESSSVAAYRRSAFRHSATITKPFYMAIFETTQMQLYLLKASYGQSGIFTGGNRYARPTLDTYQNIRGRGYNGTINWPKTGSAVSADCLLAKLRTRTNTDGWDLPTESEWEYVCRAGGVASGFWNDGSDAGIAVNTGFATIPDNASVVALDVLGRYKFNGGYVATFDEEGGTNIYTAAATSSDETHGTAIVGSYKPNAWGIYDMHGNVWELCNGYMGSTYYAWYSSSGYYCAAEYPNLVDDLGQRTDSFGEWSYRPVRGGAWNTSARDCCIALRNSNTERTAFGFRLVWRFPTPPQEPAAE